MKSALEEFSLLGRDAEPPSPAIQRSADLLATPAAQAASAAVLPHTAVLFQTHRFDPAIQRQFRKLRQDCPAGYEPILLLHDLGDLPESQRRALAQVPHFSVPTASVRDPRYAAKSAPNAGGCWSITTGGHVDLIFLKFWEANPGYHHYWVVEYDVRYTGNWGTLFSSFATSSSDLISTTVRRWRMQPGWNLWATVVTPAATPEGRPPPAKAGWIATLMPIYRASARAARTMHEAYLAGWGGHCEATWATILDWHGMAVEDLGGDGEFVRPANRGRFYSNHLTSAAHAPGTLTYRPARAWTGLRRDMLWHPVKPVSAMVMANIVELQDRAIMLRVRARRFIGRQVRHLAARLRPG